MSLCLILLGEGTALDIFKYPNFSNYTAFLCSSILKPDLIIFFSSPSLPFLAESPSKV